MYKKSVFCVVLSVCVLVICSSPGFACMYGPPFATVCEKYSNADAVVIGTITDVKAGGNGQLVKLRIDRTYKGKVIGTIELDQPLSTCDWDFDGEEDKKLLLYLSKNKRKNSYHAIGTGYGGILNEENDDVYWLNNLPMSLKRTRISGTIKLYNDEPFTFLDFVFNTAVNISNGKDVFNVVSDNKGVYQVRDVRPGKYRITPKFDSFYALDFPLSKGNVEFKAISKDEVETKDFEIKIGPDKCGGADYVLKKQK